MLKNHTLSSRSLKMVEKAVGHKKEISPVKFKKAEVPSGLCNNKRSSEDYTKLPWDELEIVLKDGFDEWKQSFMAKKCETRQPWGQEYLQPISSEQVPLNTNERVGQECTELPCDELENIPRNDFEECHQCIKAKKCERRQPWGQEYLQPISSEQVPLNTNERVGQECTELSCDELESIPRNDFDECHQCIKAKKNTVKRKKRNHCKYCRKFQTNIARHLEKFHCSEEDVKTYLLTTSDDPKTQKVKRSVIMKKIIHEGNNLYNESVINKEVEGNLIPVRNKRGSEQVSNISHRVCNTCSGLFQKETFFLHRRKCPGKFSSEKYNHNRLILNDTSHILKAKISEDYKELDDKVLSKMNQDRVAIKAQSDELILKYGKSFFNHHREPKQRHYVSSQMRTLASLLLKMEEKEPAKIQSLKSCVKPNNFEVLCKVVQDLAQLDKESGSCGIDSIPARLSKCLKRCSEITWTDAMKSSDMSIEEKMIVFREHEWFSHLMRTEWTVEVSSNANKSLKRKRVDKDMILPDSSDISMFCKHLITKIKIARDELNRTPICSVFETLVKAIICYIIVLNRRRPGEVTNCTLQNYALITNKGIIGDESKLEENQGLYVFYISANKTGDRVPVVIPKMIKDCIDTLLVVRRSLKIKGKLLFPNVQGESFDGCYLITFYKREINLHNPAHFTATGLRHHAATFSQMLPIEVKKGLPKFLGHTQQTHNRFYEMPLRDQHLNVIGPVLYAQTQHSKPNDSVTPQKRTKINQPKTRQDLATQKQKVIEYVMDEDNSDDDPNYIYSEQSNTESSDHEDDLDRELHTPPKLKRVRNRWTTPEKNELFEKLPKTMLGLKRVEKGNIKKVWSNSVHVRQNHNLQQTRIFINKYYNNKIKLSSPAKKRLMEQCNKTQ